MEAAFLAGERAPLDRPAINGHLAACRHGEVWQCIDPVRDLRVEHPWQSGEAFGRTWER